MTELQINQTIHEARGLCWHEWKRDISRKDLALKWRCKCGIEQYGEACDPIPNPNPSYTSDWKAYGEFLDWAQKQSFWIAFTISPSFNRAMRVKGTLEALLNPLRGSTAFAEWWKEKKDGK